MLMTLTPVLLDNEERVTESVEGATSNVNGTVFAFTWSSFHDRSLRLYQNTAARYNAHPKP